MLKAFLEALTLQQRVIRFKRESALPLSFNGKDARLLIWECGFDSRRGYYNGRDAYMKETKLTKATKLKKNDVISSGMTECRVISARETADGRIRVIATNGYDETMPKNSWVNVFK